MPDYVTSILTKLSAVHETRRKMRVRGFYNDPSPGMYDLKGKFEDAARSNATHERKVPPEVKEELAKVAADTLERYGFHGVKRAAEQSNDPVSALVDVFRKSDFGFDENGQSKGKTKFKAKGAVGSGSEIEATTPMPLGGFW